MVRKTIRIYKFHDVDLFYLAEHYHFNFQKAIYCSLREYLKKEICIIDLPEELDEPISIPKKSICRTLVLDEEKDKDLLDFLLKLPKGHMNGIIKNILRAYLCCPLMEPWANEYNQVFSEKKRIIQAANYDKKRKIVKDKQNKKRKNSTSDEKQNFSEFVKRNEPVMFFNKKEVEQEMIPKKTTNVDMVSTHLENEKILSVLNETEAEPQVSFQVSEDDMLTNAFSAFFD